jgi:hypothetical protein
MYMLFFTVGVVIGIILYRFFYDPKLANNQTKSNLLKPSPAPSKAFLYASVSAFFKPDFSIIISTSTFDMIYYSKTKVQAAQQVLYY